MSEEKRRPGRPRKAPGETFAVWHITTPPDVSAALEAERRPGEGDAALLVRVLRRGIAAAGTMNPGAGREEEA